MPTISALGAFTALVLAIFLILRKTPPAYGMLLAALIGGLVGGANLSQTIQLMIEGAQGITTAVLRILAAGVLAGVLIESGAAKVIAETVIQKVGHARALLALALATMLLTAVGVFVDVAVITVAPIALALAQRTQLSKPAILLSMVGGGKAGNIISPNPNAIAAADAFHVPLTSIMAAGIIPAILGVVFTYFLAKHLNSGSLVLAHEINNHHENSLPSFATAICAPLIAIVLLALRPIADIAIDPLLALPIGGIMGAILMGRIRHINAYAVSGLTKMKPVAIMLLGTGALSGIIAHSGLKDVLINTLNASSLPSYLLAPVSGILMSMATASTTAGTAIASSVFAATLLELGISSLAAAAMIHAGATVLDHMPHGSFFHATGGSVYMNIRERLKLIPYESAIGLFITLISTLIYGFFAF